MAPASGETVTTQERAPRRRNGSRASIVWTTPTDTARGAEVISFARMEHYPCQERSMGETTRAAVVTCALCCSNGATSDCAVARTGCLASQTCHIRFISTYISILNENHNYNLSIIHICTKLVKSLIFYHACPLFNLKAGPPLSQRERSQTHFPDTVLVRKHGDAMGKGLGRARRRL